jgi:hypothetical protein
VSLARVVLPIVFVCGCATDASKLSSPKIVSGIELAAYEIHEECLRLSPGERIAYRFRAQPPVSFNIHFHEGNAVIMPIDMASSVDEGGLFEADRQQTYCLMWEAGAQGSRLDYRVQPLERRQ